MAPLLTKTLKRIGLHQSFLSVSLMQEKGVVIMYGGHSFTI